MQIDALIIMYSSRHFVYSLKFKPEGHFKHGRSKTDLGMHDGLRKEIFKKKKKSIDDLFVLK